MSLSLPIELWTFIARFAVEKPWDPARFLPPPIGDFACVEGFARSSTAFREIVQMLKSEARVLSLDELSQVSRDDTSLKQVRHLEIYCRLIVLYYMKHDKTDFLPHGFTSLQCFSLVTHLSLVHPGASFTALEALSKLPIAMTLRYLEIAGRCGYVPNKKLELCFPNLSHLSLSTGPWKEIERIDEESVRIVASFLSGCQKLELFSFHVTLDKWSESGQQLTHLSGHYIPSEGDERLIVDCPCPSCWDVCVLEAVSRKECAMTRLLAERLPNLTEVRWANLLVQRPDGESGQRSTRITREGNSIVITQGRDAYHRVSNCRSAN